MIFKNKTESENSFFVSIDKIQKNEYRLTPNSYKEQIVEEISYDDPSDIIDEIIEIEKDISNRLKNIKKIL